MEAERTFTAFAGDRLIQSGRIEQTLTGVKQQLDLGETAPVLVFEDQTGAQIDFDWRGSIDDVLSRLKDHPLFAEEASRSGSETRTGPGRPRLGVVSREVSLLPRHWDWLDAQRGGISATLRRLVDEARKSTGSHGDVSRMRDAINRFMWAMTGNLPEFEEATRALFADDYPGFCARIEGWPPDVRAHLRRLARSAFSQPDENTLPSSAKLTS